MDVDAAGTRCCQSLRLHPAMVLSFSGSGFTLGSSKALSGTLELGTSAVVERF